MEKYPTFSDGKPMCLKCCNGDRCDDPTHYYRPNCPHCKGTGIATSDNVREWLLEQGKANKLTVKKETQP